MVAVNDDDIALVKVFASVNEVGHVPNSQIRIIGAQKRLTTNDQSHRMVCNCLIRAGLQNPRVFYGKPGWQPRLSHAVVYGYFHLMLPQESTPCMNESRITHIRSGYYPFACIFTFLLFPAAPACLPRRGPRPFRCSSARCPAPRRIGRATASWKARGRLWPRAW